MPSKNTLTLQHKIILFGAGNVAYNLGIAMKNKGIHIVQLFNRSSEKGEALAQMLQVPFTNSVSSLKIEESTILLFAVADDAIGEIMKSIGHVKASLIHTAGSVDASIFKGFSENYGVIYPFQTITKEKPVDFSKVSFFVEGSNNVTENRVKSLAESLSNHVYLADSGKRMLLHIAGVFTNNFTNHMMVIANEILNQADIPFEVLLPLLSETFEKVNTLGPYKAQTGPAIRGDYGTILKHVEQLQNQEDLLVLYNILTESIINFNKS